MAEHIYIGLEGCDGAGKSSIRDLLHRELLRRGMPCLIVGQHSWISPRQSKVIIGVRSGQRQYTRTQVSGAYFEDKCLHAERTVQPALKHASVLADRTYLSDAVYQDALYGIPAHQTIRRHLHAGHPLPDIVIWVYVDHDEAFRRVMSRGRQAKHYERPAPLALINRTYHQVFDSGDDIGVPRIVRYENTRDSGAWRQRAVDVLLPQLIATMQAKRAGRGDHVRID